MHPETRYVTADGARIAYQLFGRGSLMLVASSGSFSHTDSVWEDPGAALFFARLAAVVRVLRYDRLGTSNSDPFPPDWDPGWQGYLEELDAVLAAAGEARVALLALLDAGPMALRFAALHPERVDRLILYNTTARFLQDDDYPIGLAPAAYESIVTALRETWGTEAQMAMNVPSRAGDQAFTHWYGKYSRSIGTPTTMADAMTRMSALDARECLTAISCPTLVIHRSGYPVLPPSHGMYLAERIPHARYVEVPGADGPMYWEAADEILAHIIGFLAQSPAEPAPAEAVSTVLFTDIVGSTARLGEMGDTGWGALLGVHDELSARTVAAFGGRVVKSTGDGILATFPGPESAVECAQGIRRTLADMGITIRAGVHTGRVEMRGEDVGGMAVNIAARVMAHAPDGEIAVSRTVRDLLLGSRYRLDSLGLRTLKGVEGEWEIFRLATA